MIKLLNLSHVDWKPVSHIYLCFSRLIAASYNDSNGAQLRLGKLPTVVVHLIRGTTPGCLHHQNGGENKVTPGGVKIHRLGTHLRGQFFFPSQTHHHTFDSDVWHKCAIVVGLGCTASYGPAKHYTSGMCSSAPIWISNASSVWEAKRIVACQHKFFASSGKLQHLSWQKCVPPTADNSLECKLFVGFTFKLQGNVWLCNYTSWNAARLPRNCVVSVHNRRRINPLCTFLKSGFGRLTHIWSHILMSCEYKRLDANPPVSDWLWKIPAGLAVWGLVFIVRMTRHRLINNYFFF